MKHIKEYINDSLIACKGTFESLFDDEDDLLDKVPDQVIYDYLKGIVKQYQIKYVEENFYIKNGIIYCKGDEQFDLCFEGPIPPYIKFDKDSCVSVLSVLLYDGISQKDLDRVPGGVWMIESNKLSKLTIPIYKTLNFQGVGAFNKVVLKTVKEYPNIVITLGKIKQNKLTPKDLMNLSIQGKDPEVCLRIINNNAYIDIKNMLLNDPNFSKHVIKDLHCSDIVGDYELGGYYSLEYLDASGKPTSVISKGQWREHYERTL